MLRSSIASVKLDELIKMLEQKIQEIKRRETAKADFDGDVSVKQNIQEPCFRGRMSFLPLKVEANYNPNCSRGQNNIERGVSAVLSHEFLHKRYGDVEGCPGNLENHEELILEPISRKLKEKGIPNLLMSLQDGVTLYHYFSNMFEDFVVNSKRSFISNSNSLWEVYVDDGLHTPGGKFNKLFEAFLKLQLFTHGTKKARKSLRRFFTNPEEVRTVVMNFINKSGIALKDDYGRDREGIVRCLSDKQKWQTIAGIFADELSSLLELDNITAFYSPLLANEFKEDMENPENIMGFVLKKYRQGSETSGKFSPPSYLEDYYALHLLYRQLARDLEIRVRAHTKNEKMPIVWFGKRPFKSGDKLSQMKVGITEEGKIGFFSKKHHADVDMPFEYSPIGLPQINYFILDTSGSMKESIDGKAAGKIMNPWAEEKKQWHNRSKYHFALVGWETLQELARKHGTLKSTSTRLANFSSEVIIGRDLEESRKLAYTPQFNSTVLDLEKIRKAFSKKNALAVSISDGEIENWDSVKEDYIKYAKTQYYIHIHLGNKNKFTQDLENAGINVFYDSGENVGKMIIDLTNPYLMRQKQNHK